MNTKTLGIFATLGVVFSLMVGLVVGPSAALGATVFSDGFESGNFSNWTSADNDWSIINDSHSGSKAAEVKDAGSDELRKNISTTGYENITLSYWYKIPSGLSSNDHLKVQWYNGTTWTTIVNYSSSATISNWVSATHNLPAGANDNANFRFRFLGESLETSDKFRLDDVVLSANVIPTTATLTLVKEVINDNGGTAVAENFTVYINDDEVSWGSYELEAGEYTVSEDSLPGYEAGVWGGDCDEEGNVVLVAGNEYECTITNDDIAPSLTLLKEVEEGDANPEEWTLYADGPTSISGTSPVTSDDEFSAGTYALSESDGPEDYTPSGWVCEGDGEQDGANITLGLGETATCTITNEYTPPIPGSITIIKNTVGGDGTFAFEGDLGEFEITTSGGTGSQTFNELEPGIYSVSETEPNDWELTDVTCSDESDPSEINLGEDEAITCTFENTKQTGTLIVVKNLINDDEGTLDESDFSFQVNEGDPVAFEEDGENEITVLLGTYTVTEVTAEGYTTTYENCTEIEIGPGETKTCTITNNDNEPDTGTIIIVKNTIGGDGTFSFESSWLEGLFNIVTSGSTGQETFSNLTPGTYSVAEIVPEGWNFSGATCSDESDPSSIDLNAEETVTCTFTNVVEEDEPEQENPQCSDGIDNDGDTLIDYPEDPGCDNPEDNNEVNTEGSTGSIPGSGPQGQVLGVQSEVCNWDVNTFMRRGYRNDASQVRVLQQDLLNGIFNAGLVVDGLFGPKTEAAVKAFQMAKKDRILTPWGLTIPTGIFYKTTLVEAKNTICPEVILPIPTDLIPWSANVGQVPAPVN